MKFIITDFGTPQVVSDKLFATADASVNTMAVMTSIITDIIKIEKAVFASRGRRGGGSWAGLKKDTQRKKGSAEILRTTNAKYGYSFISQGEPAAPDTLYDSLTKLGAPYQILEIHDEGFEFGTNRPYASTHQSGNRARNIPARPFLRFTRTDESRWKEMLLAHVLRPFNTKESIAGYKSSILKSRAADETLFFGKSEKYTEQKIVKILNYPNPTS